MDQHIPLILIVEDEPAMGRIIKDTLSENGFETILATNGEEGVELALRKHPDLILLDILMPKMNGMEVIKRLREDAWGQKVPVIMLTNVSPDTNQALQDILNNQPAYYFIKSDIKLEEMIQKIKGILDPSTTASE